MDGVEALKKMDGMDAQTNIPQRTNQMAFMKNVVLKGLWKHADSTPFRSSEQFEASINLEIIKTKMENFEYSTSFEALQDFKTMFSDCSLLHKPDDEIFIKGKNLEKFFWSRMKSMPKEEKILNVPKAQNSSNQALQLATGVQAQGVSGRSQAGQQPNYPANSGQPGPPVGDPQECYHCHVCDKSFKSHRTLDHHMKKQHWIPAPPKPTQANRKPSESWQGPGYSQDNNESLSRMRPPKPTSDLSRRENSNKRARVENDFYCLLCQQEGHIMSTECATCLACGNKGHVRKDCQANKQVKSEGENAERNGDGENRERNGNRKKDKTSDIKSEDKNKEQDGHEKDDRAGYELVVNNDELKSEKDTEGSAASKDKREETGSEIKTESDVTAKEKDKTRKSNPSNSATPAECRPSSPKDVHNEIEILHLQVAECVKKRLDMYMLGQAGNQPKNIKIKDVEEYTRLAKFFSHKMRAQIKETYEQYNRTLVGVAITADNKEQIKVEIDMYFDTLPVVEL